MDIPEIKCYDTVLDIICCLFKMRQCMSGKMQTNATNLANFFGKLAWELYGASG